MTIRKRLYVFADGVSFYDDRQRATRRFLATGIGYRMERVDGAY